MKQHTKKLEDDDTVSTMSASESSLSMSFGVTFAEPLVTEVHLRPYTTRREKRVLFYQEQDYMEFKRDAFYGRRDTLVQFADDMVSDVWTIPALENPSEVYYTEGELQR